MTDKYNNSDHRSSTCSSGHDNNPLLKAHLQYLNALPSHVRDTFFSNKDVDPILRAEVWSQSAELGMNLVNRYSWATPDERCLKILKYFSPIVEIGCGSNAYWARKMNDMGIDIIAYDSDLCVGGKIDINDDNQQSQNQIITMKKEVNANPERNSLKKFDDGFTIRQGGPEILGCNIEGEIHQRTLFLCYPDEELLEGEKEMAYSCLEYFKGDTIIHVGELYGDTLSLDHAPWGRSSGPNFQQRLSSEFHCILKAQLTNWLHVRDTISVWKRSELCSIVFAGDGDDDSNEEVEYRHIPKDEMLTIDIAAPSVGHLLKKL